MSAKRKILAIVGSASRQSANLQLVERIAADTAGFWDVTIFNTLADLPHFIPERSLEDTPVAVVALRQAIQEADGVIICTPEYIFSIPAGLKNAIEWCVATTVFSGKPVGLITASASGVKGHEALQLIMKTIEAQFTPETTLLISGVKGKIDAAGQITDEKTKAALQQFLLSFQNLLDHAKATLPR